MSSSTPRAASDKQRLLVLRSVSAIELFPLTDKSFCLVRNNTFFRSLTQLALAGRILELRPTEICTRLLLSKLPQHLSQTTESKHIVRMASLQLLDGPAGGQDQQGMLTVNQVDNFDRFLHLPTELQDIIWEATFDLSPSVVYFKVKSTWGPESKTR